MRCNLKLQEMSLYLLLVVFVAAIGLSIDVIISNVDVQLESTTILDQTGKKVNTLQVSYPLWHQVLGLITNFFYGLAAAIFITVFVANRLQKSQQDEKQKELNKLNELININVFDGLFKTIIPKEIFKVIKQDIIESRVVRKEAKWIYDFSLSGGKIVCRMTTRYELHNLSQETVTDPIKLELDALGGDEYKIILAECLSRSGERTVHYDPSDLENNKNISIDHQGNKTTVEYSVSIPPENFVEYKTVFERTYDSNIVDAQVTKVPVIGADIIVNFPQGYKFEISPTMSNKPRLITESSIQKIYRVEGGILPYQGFTYYLVKNG